MSNYEFEGLGYRRDLEPLSDLLAGAQKETQFVCGDVDIKNLGDPMGVAEYVRIENQQRLNSCAGNSATSILEACLWHQSGGQVTAQLSRMFAYTNGQRYAGIRGDSGATLKGVIDGLSKDGCPLEELCPYTGAYYIATPATVAPSVKADAASRKLLSYVPITHVDQVYEGLAKRVGGFYLGACWNGQFRSPLPGGYVNDFFEQSGCGFHAVCVLDWCEEKDDQGYPRLDLFNSHGLGYGFKGRSKWSRQAMQKAITAPNTTAFFLSDMQFIKPRFDWAKHHWTSVD